MKHFERILKTSGILYASPEDTISSALSRLTSSHDAAFVFDDKKKFMGVINPYYCLIKSFNPGHTKVEHCLFHPPRVTSQDSLERITRLMTESKIHYLPVFDDKNNFLGITSARRILQIISELDISSTKIRDVLTGKNGNVVSVYLDDTLGVAMNLFKEHKVSKLVVIDKNMKLKGILSYYDLIPYLLAPGVSKTKGRGAKTGDDKEKLMNMKVKNYAKTTTLTLTDADSIKVLIDSILKKKKGSVVIIDKESHPIGILTTKDIFTLLEAQNNTIYLEVTTKHLAPEHEKMIAQLATFIEEHVKKSKLYIRSRLLVEEEKDGGLFRIHLYLEPHKGDVEVVQREAKDLKSMIVDIRQTLKALDSKK